MFNELFDFDLSKPLTEGNHIITVSAFSFNQVIDSETKEKQYNFRIEGTTKDGRPWTDTVFPNIFKNSKGEVTGNGFSRMLKSIQRQIAPDEDWTPPKTKAKFDEWLLKREEQIVGSDLKVNATYNTFISNGRKKTKMNLNYYHMDESPEKALTF